MKLSNFFTDNQNFYSSILFGNLEAHVAKTENESALFSESSGRVGNVLKEYMIANPELTSRIDRVLFVSNSQKDFLEDKNKYNDVLVRCHLEKSEPLALCYPKEELLISTISFINRLFACENSIGTLVIINDETITIFYVKTIDENFDRPTTIF